MRIDAAGLNEGGRMTGLVYGGDQGITLANSVLVEDDATAIGQPQGATERSWFEVLDGEVRILKELVLDDGRAHAAWLTWCGVEAENNDVPLHLSVNGVDVLRPPTKQAHPQCRHYYTSDWAPSHFDNWFVAELPVSALRSGTNTIEMWTNDVAATDEVGVREPGWQVMVAADSERERGADPPLPPVGRSARSRDGGDTWERDGLGQKNEIKGEYCVRLSLDRYGRSGVFRSAAIDVTGTDADVIRPDVTVDACSATWEVEGTGDVALRIRFADSPDVDAANAWSDWQGVEGLSGSWQAPAGRWLQFEATLRTDDPLVSPSLQGVTVVAQALPRSTNGAHARLLEMQNGHVTRSSMDYTWENPEALRDLRQRFELDQVVDGAATQFEAQLRLMHWAYRIPIGRLDPYAWRYDDLPQLEREEDGSIRLLGPYEQPRREGHCLFCNFTLIAGLLSLGYPARWVNISTKHTYGHEVTEVWSDDFDKWVFLDATRDYYMVDPDTGVPLSLVEIGERVGEILTQPVTWEQPIPAQLPQGVSPDNVRVTYRPPHHGGPVFVDGADHDLLMIGHLQMPRRNDFATRPQPVPWRLSSNWGSSEFTCWSSRMFPPKLEYAHGTNRRQDWEPSLNRAQLTLSETADVAVLRVDAETVTPWFEAFEVRVDGGDWQTQSDARWSWELHEGRNELQVRIRNSCGIRGRESTAAVVFTP